MAVHLRYRLVAATDEAIHYEVSTGADDPDPVVVRFSSSVEEPVPLVNGAKVAANRAIRKIHARRVLEGTWPRGGVIQS